MSKHDEVYNDIRGKILSGAYAPLSALDNEAVLCKRYGVSRPTLKKAIDRLKQDGLVHSKQGSGTYVNPPEFFEKQNLDTLTERMAGSGHVVTSRVMLLERVPCGDLESMFLIGRDEELIHYIRIRDVDGVPHAIEETYMPAYLFEGFEERVLYGSMIDYIENVCGYELSHEVRTVSAVIPNELERAGLKLGEDRALLRIVHQVYLTRSVAVQHTVELTTDESIRITSVR